MKFLHHGCRGNIKSKEKQYMKNMFNHRRLQKPIEVSIKEEKLEILKTVAMHRRYNFNET